MKEKTSINYVNSSIGAEIPFIGSDMT